MKYGWYVNKVKPWLDRCAAVLILIPALPVMAVCAAAVKLDDPRGRILFSQERNGERGKVFRIYKFRTMRQELCTGKEQPLPASFTKVGKVLRLLSLDELPQLWNILKGEMSFIGPRPLPTGYYPWFTKTERKRFLAKPGLTGLAQVCGRAHLDWGKRFRLDVYYVENLSPALDLYIIIRTVRRLLAHDDVVMGGQSQLNFDEYRRRQREKETDYDGI